MQYYRKHTTHDVLVKAIGTDGSYSVASRNDPEPDGYLPEGRDNPPGWLPISRQDAAEILGYDPEEGLND